jgi:hypothetical protein
MKRIVTAAALAVAVSASALWAQSEPSMDEALSMLELSAKRELTAIGLGDVDPMSLSLNQLGRIHSIMGTGSTNEGDKAREIRQVVEGG